MVNIQLLLHQRVFLDTRGFVRVDGLLSGFLRQGQSLAVNRLLQQLQLMLQTVDVCGDVVALFLQGILQDGIAFQALALLFDLGIQQLLLRHEQRLLRGA